MKQLIILLILGICCLEIKGDDTKDIVDLSKDMKELDQVNYPTWMGGAFGKRSDQVNYPAWMGGAFGKRSVSGYLYPGSGELRKRAVSDYLYPGSGELRKRAVSDYPSWMSGGFGKRAVSDYPSWMSGGFGKRTGPFAPRNWKKALTNLLSNIRKKVEGN